MEKKIGKAIVLNYDGKANNKKNIPYSKLQIEI